MSFTGVHPLSYSRPARRAWLETTTFIQGDIMRIQYALLAMSLILNTVACEQTNDPSFQTKPMTELEQPLGYWFNDVATIRYAPDYAERIPDPKGPSDMLNSTGTVFRGMTAKVTATKGEWRRIIYNKNAHGWIPVSELTPRTASNQATTLKNLKTYLDSDFGKPDETIIPAGSLLFVLEEAGELSYVNYDGQAATWVETALLTKDPNELKVAESIAKADWMATVMQGPNGRIFDKARIKYPKAKLLDQLAEKIDFNDFNLKPVMPTTNLAEDAIAQDKK